MIAKLALEDGTVFTGVSFGTTGTRTGEVVFNTALTGYQEVITDPSYCGQIVTMTFPLMGNYGVNPDDVESGRPHLSGFVVKELPTRPSNFRATADLPEVLRELGVIGIAGVDTRALTRRVRVQGALRGVVSTEITDDVQLVRQAQAAPLMNGANLVEQVAPSQFGEWNEGLWTFEPAAAGQTTEPGCHVAVIDCGVKRNILRHLSTTGCRVTVAPASASAGEILDRRPDAIVVSNGPGDPAAVRSTVATLRDLVGRVPLFGICLGHQMLALALGAETYKLRFGHHGANVPVMNRRFDRVEITSQNHGFAVTEDSLLKVGAEASHINLNDNSIEGLFSEDKQVLAVQFHPEASPGPHDADYLFANFVAAVRAKRPLDGELLRPVARTAGAAASRGD